MREIKFRAWLHDEQQMVYANDQASTDSCEIWSFRDNNLVVQVQETIWKEGGGETFERIEYVDCNHEIMQFIGLLDSKGVEIYEGDIVGYSITNPYTDVDDEYIGNVGFDSGNYMADEWYLSFVNNLEVIGNIYQNPSLLPTTDDIDDLKIVDLGGGRK